jgi:hypothetical protein
VVWSLRNIFRYLRSTIVLKLGMSEAIVISRTSLRQLPDYAKNLSDAGLRKGVRVGMVLFARSIKPLEGNRPWLR